MIEKTRQRGVVEMGQYTRIGFENQHVDERVNLNQFALDIPWTFTYHTQARAQEKCGHAGVA